MKQLVTVLVFIILTECCLSESLETKGHLENEYEGKNISVTSLKHRGTVCVYHRTLIDSFTLEITFSHFKYLGSKILCLNLIYVSEIMYLMVTLYFK